MIKSLGMHGILNGDRGDCNAEDKVPKNEENHQCHVGKDNKFLCFGAGDRGEAPKI